MSEVAGASGELVSRLVLYRELDEILDRGLTGKIELHVRHGDVLNYHVTEVREPGKERRTMERRTGGYRDGDDRRKR